MKSKDSTKG